VGRVGLSGRKLVGEVEPSEKGEAWWGGGWGAI
jgi:hypothetical protein